jgi:hypothetical protein
MVGIVTGELQQESVLQNYTGLSNCRTVVRGKCLQHGSQAAARCSSDVDHIQIFVCCVYKGGLKRLCSTRLSCKSECASCEYIPHRNCTLYSHATAQPPLHGEGCPWGIFVVNRMRQWGRFPVKYYPPPPNASEGPALAQSSTRQPTVFTLSHKPTFEKIK